MFSLGFAKFSLAFHWLSIDFLFILLLVDRCHVHIRLRMALARVLVRIFWESSSFTFVMVPICVLKNGFTYCTCIDVSVLDE